MINNLPVVILMIYTLCTSYVFLLVTMVADLSRRQLKTSTFSFSWKLETCWEFFAQERSLVPTIGERLKDTG